ncbi:hypothetical protein, partial [Escherichia coli]
YALSISWSHYRIYEYINNEQLGKLNPPENLRIAIEKFC